MDRGPIPGYALIALARAETSFGRNGGFWSARRSRDVRTLEARVSTVNPRIRAPSAGLMLLLLALPQAALGRAAVMTRLAEGWITRPPPTHSARRRTP